MAIEWQVDKFTADGVKDTFTLSYPIASQNEELFFVKLDGIDQIMGETEAFTIGADNQSIVFNEIPANGIEVKVIYLANK